MFSEWIRGGKPTKENQKFQWNEFVRQAKGEGASPTIEDRLEAMKWYVDSTNIEKLGTGGSRAVFLLSSKSVLKVALHGFGIAQNKQEIELSANASTEVPIARVLTSDPDGLWLVAQLVRQVKDEDEFASLVGYDLSEATEQVQYMFMDDKAGISLKREDYDPGIWMMWSAVKAGDLNLADIEYLEHWGVNPDGEIVLLDYGFTNSMSAASIKDMMKVQ